MINWKSPLAIRNLALVLSMLVLFFGCSKRKNIIKENNVSQNSKIIKNDSVKQRVNIINILNKPLKELEKELGKPIKSYNGWALMKLYPPKNGLQFVLSVRNGKFQQLTVFFLDTKDCEAALAILGLYGDNLKIKERNNNTNFLVNKSISNIEGLPENIMSPKFRMDSQVFLERAYGNMPEYIKIASRYPYIGFLNSEFGP